ncbi:MAG: DUF5050 domain-containing protein, partial [Clostridia bacterium]|nr:DUF5050 domain-containing protein [Clostridia bacterium]
VDKDENEVKTLKNVELVVPKVVSCENGDFYIFGDYIYYASPTTEKDKTGNSRFDLVTFFCCNINGSETKKLFAVDSYGSNAKFNMICVDDKVYLEIFDGSKITILTIQGNKVKDEKVVSSGSSITDVIFPKEETFNKDNNTIEEGKTFVYYTRAGLESERYQNCNVLCRASVKTATEEKLIADNEHTISLKGYNKNYLYYTVTDKNSHKDNFIVYATSLDEIKGGVKSSDQISYVDTEKVFVIESETLVGIIAVTDSNKMHVVLKDSMDASVVYDKELTVITVKGDYVYGYNTSNQLVMVNFLTKEEKVLTSTEDSLYFNPKNNLDICGSYLYYFNTYTGDSETGYYLNRIEVNADSTEAELVGEVDAKYIKTETETKEEE